VSLRSGLSLRAGRRSDEEVAAGRILVSRFDRGDSPDSRKKLRDRVCVQLPHVLTSPDYSALLSSDTSTDLGSSAISTQTAIDGVIDWAITHDVFYVCNIPVDVDLTNVSAVGTSETFVNLLTGYKTVSFEQVALYQELVNTFGVEVDVESSTWLLQVLLKSTESTLLVQAKQRFDTLRDTQKGGLTLFKLLVDRIDYRSFESTQALLNFITSFQLTNFDGENVPLATARFKAVVRLLPTAAIPPNLLEYFLNGMAACASDDFKDACKSQLGFISNPIYTDWAVGRDLLSQLDRFAATLEAKYTALCTLQKWDGSHQKASVFKADHRGSSSSSSPQHHQFPTYREWFLHQTCATCGKNHPTWAHGKPDALEKKERRIQQQQASNSSSRSKLRFKSSAAKTKFSAAVHQAMIDCCDGDLTDCDLYAHLAGDGPSPGDIHDTSSNSAEDSTLSGQDASVATATDDDLGISALVAEGLGNLLLN
jgi:hypothetical protein